MPQEPEKKIEELLKAYAKKRREDRGAPLEIHPATRKLLQTEVARLRAKPAPDSRSWFQSLTQFWPRIGFAASIVIALGVVIWKLDLENRRSKEFAQAARPPAMEMSSRDESREKDVTLQREALDESSARERDAKPTARAEKMVEESRSVRPGEAPAIANNEMLLAETDASKRFEKQAKLKEAVGGKSDQPSAPREQLADGLSPVTQRQKNAPVLDGPLSSIETLEIARNPTGAVQAGGGGGAAAQSSLARNRAGENLVGQDLKVTPADNNLGLLLAPNVTTNAVVAYSINGTATFVDTYNYSFQDSSGFSNALFGSVANYTVFQNPMPAASSSNLQLFADSRANVPNLVFRQETSWNEPSTLNKKVSTIRAADPVNLSVAKSEQRVTQEPEAAKTLSTLLSVDKDGGGLARWGQSRSDQTTATWHFVAEELQTAQAGKEVELIADVPSPEQPIDSRYRGATKSGAPGRPLAASAVLKSFQMDLNGDRIRLTDADGSVYEGQLAAPNQEGSRKSGDVQALTEATRRLDDAEKKQERVERGKTVLDYDAQPGPASFRVSGTNRSLNQLVVMDAVLSRPSGSRDEPAAGAVAGRLRAVDSVSASTPAPAVAPAPTTPVPTSAVAAQKPAATRTAARQPVITPTLKIQGKARIGATNEVSINAIRVAP